MFFTTCWKTLEVGENIYLPGHINVFWLASPDGITSPFFMFGVLRGLEGHVMAATPTIIPGNSVATLLK